VLRMMKTTKTTNLKTLNLMMEWEWERDRATKTWLRRLRMKSSSKGWRVINRTRTKRIRRTRKTKDLRCSRISKETCKAKRRQKSQSLEMMRWMM